MSKRFQIEDIEVQDSSGIVFRAADMLTHGPVALRRFFPFGPTSVGLNAEDQASYGLVLSRFEEIRHPALRSIIDGGCDAVDGVPYIVAEWIEGDLLDILLEHRPLNQPEATALIDLALDACEALTGLLGEEGVWIETAPNTIVIRPVGAQRPFTFWISPLRWLSRTVDPRGLEPLIGLTESIMGVADLPFDSLPETGTGGWLRWLREAAATASLREAREMLARFTGTEPPPAAAAEAVIAGPGVGQPAKTKIKSRSKAPAWILTSTVLLALGLGGWMLVRRNVALIAEASAPLESSVKILTSDALPPSSPPVKLDGLDEPAVAVPSAISPSSGDRSPEQDARRLKIQDRGFFTLDDGEFLLEENGKDATLEGRLEVVRFTQDGEGPTLFLEFSDPYENDQPRGYVMRKDLTSNMNEAFFRKLIGKTVQIHGKVRKNGKRTEIKVKGSASVVEVP